MRKTAARSRARGGLAAVAVCVLVACSNEPPTGGGVTTGQQTQGDLVIDTVENIAYAETSLHQTLDIYLPDDGEPTHPVAVYLHGGGWRYGDKTGVNDEAIANIKAMRDAFLEAGYAVVAVNYRLTTEAIWPAQIADVKSAVRFLRANAEHYQLDPQRIIAWGESAGAHLAQMMALTNGEPTLEGSVGELSESSDVSAAVSFYGVSDVQLTGLDSLHCSSTGGEVGQSALVGGTVAAPPGSTIAALASPINYVDSSDAPILLIHGQQDCVVAPIQSQRLFDKLTYYGVPTELALVPGQHSSPELFTDPALQDQALDFLATYA